MTSYYSTDSAPAEDGVLRNEMDDGEQLLWSGKPRPSRLAMQMLPVSVFGLFFGGFAIVLDSFALGMILHAGPAFSHGATSSSGTPAMAWIFPVFGLPFVAVGLGMILSPLFAFRRAKTTVYGVTDCRAIIVTARRGKTVKSYRARDIDNISRVERSDGTGDVTFAHQYSYTNDGNRNTTTIGFFGIPEPREVEKMIQAIVDHDKSSGADSSDYQGPPVPISPIR